MYKNGRIIVESLWVVALIFTNYYINIKYIKITYIKFN